MEYSDYSALLEEIALPLRQIHERLAELVDLFDQLLKKK